MRVPVLPAVLLTLTAISVSPGLGQDAARPPAALTPAPAGDHFLLAVLPDGDTLRYTISVPPGLDPWTPVPLVMALHWGTMAAPWVGGAYLHDLVLPAFEGMNAILVAPDALTQREASYRTERWTSERNEAAVLWLTRRLMASYPVDPKKVVLTGYSAGSAGVWFLAEKYPDLFAAAIPVSGRPPFDRVPTLKIPFHVIHSWNDEVISAMMVQSAVEQMKAAGADIEMRIIADVTHYQTSFFYEPLRDALPWLERKLSRAR